MKKLIIAVAVIIIVILVARDVIIKTSVVKGVKAVTGLELGVKSIKTGIIGTSLEIKGLQLFNPPAFHDKLMLDMPEVFVDYDLGSILKKEIHLETVRVNLQEFVVVKNEKGELNINSLKAVGTKEEPPAEKPPTEGKKGEMPKIRVDVLELKVGKVIYKDYSKGSPPKVTEFNIRLDERHENITDPKKLIGLIVFKALVNTSVAGLADFDLGPLEEKLGVNLGTAREKIKDFYGKSFPDTSKTGDVVGGARDAIDEAADKIKKLLPFGDKKEE